MRKILFVILVLGILIVSGCKAPEETKEPTGVSVGDKAPTVREVSTGKEDIVKGPELSQELKTLFAKADTVDSIEYFYHEAEEGAYYYVVDKNIRITFPSRRHLGGIEWYTDVYIDLNKKTAKGYCEIESCREEVDIPADIDQSLLNLETPFEVLESISYGEQKGDETISGKRAIIVESPLSGGNTQRTWVWDYKGIPIRYTVVNSDGDTIKRVDYEGLAINSVKMDYVTK